MKIGELAAATSTAAETIRFYERKRLLPKPARSGGNYRIYSVGHAKRLAFIRHCRSLDMTLDEIRVLLRFQDSPPANCRNVSELLEEHLEHVTERISELKALEGQLKQLRQLCRNDNSGGSCGILEGLTQNGTRPTKRKASAHSRGLHRRM